LPEIAKELNAYKMDRECKKFKDFCSKQQSMSLFNIEIMRVLTVCSFMPAMRGWKYLLKKLKI